MCNRSIELPWNPILCTPTLEVCDTVEHIVGSKRTNHGHVAVLFSELDPSKDSLARSFALRIITKPNDRKLKIRPEKSGLCDVKKCFHLATESILLNTLKYAYQNACVLYRSAKP